MVKQSDLFLEGTSHTFYCTHTFCSYINFFFFFFSNLKIITECFGFCEGFLSKKTKYYATAYKTITIWGQFQVTDPNRQLFLSISKKLQHQSRDFLNLTVGLRFAWCAAAIIIFTPTWCELLRLKDLAGVGGDNSAIVKAIFKIV